MKKLKINDAGLNLLKKWEGFSNVAYPDGGGVWTIGYGFTSKVKKGDTMTREQADERLKSELVSREECVNENICRDLTGNQFSALVCLCYNIGCEAFIGSTLARMLNQQAPIQNCSLQFLRWNKDNGQTVEGLTNRREAEKELFLT